MTALTVVVCTRNRAATYLPRALASLAAQEPVPGGLEVVVVDNASTDATAEVVARSPFRSLREPRVGLSHARNTGVRAARAPLVAFLDDDAIADPRWGAVIARRFADDPALSALSGPVTGIWEAPRPPWLHPHLDGVLGLRSTDDGRLFGGNAAYRRAALTRVGGFAGGLGRAGDALDQGEDDELAARLREAGLAIAYDPAMRIDHHVPATRLTRPYFLAWARGSGRALARMRVMAGRNPGRSALGAALRALRRAPALVGGTPATRFVARFELTREAALITELARLRRHPPAPREWGASEPDAFAPLADDDVADWDDGPITPP